MIDQAVRDNEKSGIEAYMASRLDESLAEAKRKAVAAARAKYDWLKAHDDDTAALVGRFGEVVFGRCNHEHEAIKHGGKSAAFTEPCQKCAELAAKEAAGACQWRR